MLIFKTLKKAIYAFYLSLFIASNAIAITVYTVEITADTLNVRKSSNLNSEIIGTLSKGEQVSAIPYLSGWYHISYQGKSAYISEKHTKVIGSNEISIKNKKSNDPCDPSNVKINLEITKSKLDCSNSFDGKSISSCNAIIDYTLSTHCNQFYNVFVDCDATFDYEYLNSFDHRVKRRTTGRGSASAFLANGYAFDAAEVKWSTIIGLTNDIVSVKLIESSCRIMSVYD